MVFPKQHIQCTCNVVLRVFCYVFSFFLQEGFCIWFVYKCTCTCIYCSVCN